MARGADDSRSAFRIVYVSDVSLTGVEQFSGPCLPPDRDEGFLCLLRLSPAEGSEVDHFPDDSNFAEEL